MATRLEIVAVGSLHREFLPVAQHYQRLLAPPYDVTVREVREVPLRGRGPGEVLRDEARRLEAAWPHRPVVAALDAGGRRLSSEEFAGWLGDGVERGGVAFVIGGSLGLAAEVLERADERVSLSALTFPHQLARVILLEQLFRAGKILRGEAYHH